MARLSKILNSGRIVFADKSALRRTNPRNLGWVIYEASDFCELDCDELEQEIEETRQFIELLGHPNIRTTPGITGHTRFFEGVIDEKIGFASERESKRGKYRKSRKNEKGARQKDLILRLQEVVYKARLMCRDKEFQRHMDVDKETYEQLAGMVFLVSRLARLKRDTAYKFGQRREDMSQKTDVPERVVASLYYLSMFSPHSPALLTGNTNYVRIMGIIQGLLSADEFFPDNQEFREALERQNPVKLYMRRKRREGYSLALNTSKLREPVPGLFEVKNMTPERNRELRDAIGRAWHSLAKEYQPA
jgi:uncharacterized protein (UPF0303 family)